MLPCAAMANDLQSYTNTFLHKGVMIHVWTHLILIHNPIVIRTYSLNQIVMYSAPMGVILLAAETLITSDILLNTNAVKAKPIT